MKGLCMIASAALLLTTALSLSTASQEVGESLADSTNHDQVMSVRREVEVLSRVQRQASPPTFISPSLNTSISNSARVGITVLVVSAVDNDLQGTMQFDIQGPPTASEYFSIQPDTGVISVRKDLRTDSEAPSKYILVLGAYDSARPTQIATAIATIHVIRNPHAPQFYTSNYTATVQETIPVDGYIVSLSVYDGDEDAITCNISHATPPEGIDFFGVTSLGMLYAKQSLTESATNVFKVEAKDNGVPPRSAFANVTVKVLWSNEFSPVFSNLPAGIVIPSAMPAGAAIFTVSATDSDRRIPYNTVNFSIIEDGQVSSFFVINSESGAITTLDAFDLSNDNFTAFIVRVLATDGGRPARNSTGILTLVVNKADNNEGDTPLEKKDNIGTIVGGIVGGVVGVTVTAIIIICVYRQRNHSYEATISRSQSHQYSELQQRHVDQPLPSLPPEAVRGPSQDSGQGNQPEEEGHYIEIVSHKLYDDLQPVAEDPKQYTTLQTPSATEDNGTPENNADARVTDDGYEVPVSHQTVPKELAE